MFPVITPVFIFKTVKTNEGVWRPVIFHCFFIILLNTCTYTFQTTAHSGENKFRVKQIGYGDLSKSSANVTFVSATGQPTYTMAKASDAIEFSAETMYEVFDSYGNVIKRGFGSKLDIANLLKGSYYLCYDNIMTDFNKKK